MAYTIDYFGPDRDFFDTAFLGSGSQPPLNIVGTPTATSARLSNSETGAVTDLVGTGFAFST